MKNSEAQIEAYLVARVEQSGGITAKMTVSGRRGWPDRLVIMPGGRMALAELKRPKGGRLSAGQKTLMDRLEEMETPVFLLKSMRDVDHLIYTMQIPPLWRAMVWGKPPKKQEGYDRD